MSSTPDGVIQPIPQLAEKQVSARLLSAMAVRVSEEQAKFSSWMVAGVGAILGLLVANLDKVSNFIGPDELASAIRAFVVAVSLNVIQRFLAAVVIASGSLAKEAESMPLGEATDPRVIFAEIERASFRPARWLIAKMNRQVLTGDIVAGARMLARLAQIQGWLVLAQMVAVVVSALTIANALS